MRLALVAALLGMLVAHASADEQKVCPADKQCSQMRLGDAYARKQYTPLPQKVKEQNYCPIPDLSVPTS